MPHPYNKKIRLEAKIIFPAVDRFAANFWNFRVPGEDRVGREKLFLVPARDQPIGHETKGASKAQKLDLRKLLGAVGKERLT